ncbi:MAG: helix-turn-helix domain-containing protein [Bacteroidota bacterium]
MDFDENKLTREIMQERYSKYGTCPVAVAIGKIGGKWKPIIIYILSHGTCRFSELLRMIEGVSKTMLTAQLRELEKDRLIHREVFAEVPPRVEYSLTELGKTLRPVMMSLCEWSEANVLRQEVCEN